MNLQYTKHKTVRKIKKLEQFCWATAYNNLCLIMECYFAGETLSCGQNHFSMLEKYYILSKFNPTVMNTSTKHVFYLEVQVVLSTNSVWTLPWNEMLNLVFLVKKLPNTKIKVCFRSKNTKELNWIVDRAMQLQVKHTLLSCPVAIFYIWNKYFLRH